MRDSIDSKRQTWTVVNPGSVERQKMNETNEGTVLDIEYQNGISVTYHFGKNGEIHIDTNGVIEVDHEKRTIRVTEYKQR